MLHIIPLFIYFFFAMSNTFVHSIDLNTQQCSQQNIQQVNHYSLQPPPTTIKLSPSPQPSSDNSALLSMEKHHVMNSLSTAPTGGYICSTSTENTKMNLPQQQAIRISQLQDQDHNMVQSKGSTTLIGLGGGGSICIETISDKPPVTARKSMSHNKNLSNVLMSRLVG